MDVRSEPCVLAGLWPVALAAVVLTDVARWLPGRARARTVLWVRVVVLTVRGGDFDVVRHW